VTRELLNRLPASAELTLLAFALAVLVAVPLGLAAALRPGSALDHACRLLATLGGSLPTFVTGLLLIYLFYYLWGLAPEPIGRIDPFLAPERITGFLLLDTALAGDGEGFAAAARQIVLPAVTMALFALAPLARMARAAMRGVLSSDFIRAARASGLSRGRIVFGYAFRNAALPLVGTLGMTFSYMLGANVLVEKVFAWPGIGAFALDSLIGLDYAPLQGFMLVMAAIFLGVNLLTDLVQALIDPRAGLADG
jgi:peptide/nickel transport system permease protein